MAILILGHYGGNNFGDEIMLYSLLESIKTKTEERIYVVSKPRSRHYFFDEGVEYLKPNPIQILKALNKVDQVVLGGGTHFHDGYNSTRLRKHYIYLIKVLLFFCICKLLGKKVYQLGVGFGPFYGSLVKRLASFSIALSDKVTVRDVSSLKTLGTYGLDTKKVHRTFDLAALYPAFINPGSPAEEARKWIGISVMSFKYSEYNHSEDFWRMCFFKLLSSFYAENHIKLKIFVFRGGNRESDAELSRELYEILSRIDDSRVELVPFTESIKVFVDELLTCRKFVATRYHSALLAYLCKCELLIIPYHQKLLSFASDIKLSDQAILNFHPVNVEDAEIKLFNFLNGTDGQFTARINVQDSIQLSRENLTPLDTGS
jgi:polysaccharide pyruvyl transferase WcaK-like protein